MRSGLRLVSLAAAPYRWPLSANHRDLSVYIAIRRELRWKRAYLVVESPDGRRHVGHRSGVAALYVPVPRLRALGLLIFGLAAVRIALRLCKPSQTVLQASDPLGSGLPAVLIKRLLHVPTLVQLQGDLLELPPEIALPKRVAIRFVTMFVLRRADRIRCVSRVLAEKAQRAGIQRERISYVPSRCDTQHFHRSSHLEAAGNIRRQLGIGPSTKVVLFVGAITVHKGVQHLLNAVALVATAQPDVRVLIVGAGPLLSVAREHAQQLGVGSIVHFIGRVPDVEVPAYMAGSDVFVLPSLDEGLPRVILEAMSMELVVVASRVGGIPEAVVDGSTGYLVPPASAELLAQALLRAMGEPHDELRARARATVVAKYDFTAGIRRYAEMLRNLIPRS
jgi:glycosyltransferase involved in cell wall biosynthesis